MKKFAKIMAVMLLVALTVTALVACGYSTTGDPDKDKAKLEKKGFDVQVMKVNAGGIKATLVAEKYSKNIEEIEDLEEIKDVKVHTISITYFEKEEDAKEAYDEAKKGEEDAPKGVKYSVSRKGATLVVEISGTMGDMGE